MAQQWNPGHLVKLKSGSNTMTVTHTNTKGDGKVWCIWWVPATHKFETEGFPGDALKAERSGGRDD